MNLFFSVFFYVTLTKFKFHLVSSYELNKNHLFRDVIRDGLNDNVYILKYMTATENIMTFLNKYLQKPVTNPQINLFINRPVDLNYYYKKPERMKHDDKSRKFFFKIKAHALLNTVNGSNASEPGRNKESTDPAKQKSSQWGERCNDISYSVCVLDSQCSNVFRTTDEYRVCNKQQEKMVCCDVYHFLSRLSPSEKLETEKKLETPSPAKHSVTTKSKSDKKKKSDKSKKSKKKKSRFRNFSDVEDDIGVKKRQAMTMWQNSNVEQPKWQPRQFRYVEYENEPDMQSYKSIYDQEDSNESNAYSRRQRNKLSEDTEEIDSIRKKVDVITKLLNELVFNTFNKLPKEKVSRKVVESLLLNNPEFHKYIEEKNFKSNHKNDNDYEDESSDYFVDT